MPDLDVRSRCDGLTRLRIAVAARCEASGRPSAMVRLRTTHAAVSSFPIA